MNQRRRATQRIGAGDKVGLVRGEEIEHGHLNPASPSRALGRLGQARSAPAAMGMIVVGQHPAQRGERASAWDPHRGAFAKNCRITCGGLDAPHVGKAHPG